MSEGASVSLTVVEKIADREGTDPAELHPPLHTVIDTDALDTLFQSTPSAARADGTIEFQYKGYQVRIDGSGEVQIGEIVSFTEKPETQPYAAENPISE